MNASVNATQYIYVETKVEKEDVNESYFIGVALALSSSIFIGVSFILNKISHLKLSESNSLGAGAGGFGYLKEWIWWSGILSMGFGEFLNLIAYGFAPATLVTPLGALSVVISAVLASKYLDEHLTSLGKVGCVLCIIGSIIIILSAPRGVNSLSISDLLQGPIIGYTIFVVFLSLYLICLLDPEYGKKYVLVYVIICSLVGSFTVVASQVLALSIRGEFLGVNNGYNYIFLSLAVLILCACIQLTYLNKALDIFGPTIVTPIYYVFFTTLVLFFSTVLFKEWEQMTLLNVLGTLIGLLVAFTAIFFIHIKKERSGEDLLLKNRST